MDNMIERAEEVLADLERRFGQGFSNGVYAILAHDGLPEQFDKRCWKDWFFKPADAAFDLAHNMGLIAPWKRSRKWTLTDLGKAASAEAQARFLALSPSPAPAGERL
jgi:hypothetical protein